MVSNFGFLLVRKACNSRISKNELVSFFSFPLVNLENPVAQFSPLPFDGFSCERLHITGISRLNLKKYASSIHVTLKVSEVLPEILDGKIQVCFHRDTSRGLCQCKEESWEFLQKGQWDSATSAYTDEYIDVKVNDKTSTSLSISIEEEFHAWRLAFQVLGVILLLFAPIVSEWAPFYYISSALGFILVLLLIIVFQGMKSLPIGREKVLYLPIYGYVFGVGSYVEHYFYTIINSIVRVGFYENMNTYVSVLLLVLIILAGAASVHWIVQKIVLSEDGSVDAGIAQLVKWAIRITAVTSTFLSTLDAPSSLVVLAAALSICSLIPSRKSKPKSNVAFANNQRAEFFSSSKMNMVKATWGVTAPSSDKQASIKEKDYYSTFHKMPLNNFTEKDWKDFTYESTSSALAEWASTPEFVKWLAENAHRMRLDRESCSSSTPSLLSFFW